MVPNWKLGKLSKIDAGKMIGSAGVHGESSICDFKVWIMAEDRWVGVSFVVFSSTLRLLFIVELTVAPIP